MTPAQYKAAIARLKLSQAGAASLLGVNERTSRRWIAGDREVPAPVARFLRYLIAAKVSPQDVLDALATK